MRASSNFSLPAAATDFACSVTLPVVSLTLSRNPMGPPGAKRSSATLSSVRRRDPETVSVGIDEVDLAAGEPFLVDDLAELAGDLVDVAHVEVHERARSRVPRVLGEVQAHLSTGDRREHREAGLEPVLPLLGEAEALVPRDG